jgi:hypothetical protein
MLQVHISVGSAPESNSERGEETSIFTRWGFNLLPNADTQNIYCWEMRACVCTYVRAARQQGEQSAPAETKTLQAFPNCPIRAEQRAYLLIKLFFPSRWSSACLYLPARRLSRVIIQKTAYNSLVCALAIMRWQPHTHTHTLSEHIETVGPSLVYIYLATWHASDKSFITYICNAAAAGTPSSRRASLSASAQLPAWFSPSNLGPEAPPTLACLPSRFFVCRWCAHLWKSEAAAPTSSPLIIAANQRHTHTHTNINRQQLLMCAIRFFYNWLAKSGVNRPSVGHSAAFRSNVCFRVGAHRL